MEPVERVARHFQSELEQLKTRLLEMGGLAEEQVRLAVKALVDRDRDLVERVLHGDEPLNAPTSRSTAGALLCWPLSADGGRPARDRVGREDQHRSRTCRRSAINIAEAARRYASQPPVKRLIDIPRMAALAQTMLRDALDAFVRRDIDLAQQVLNEDDKLDSLKTQIFRELLTYMLQDTGTIEPALDLILISRHLERIGDHATNVAEDVIFMVSARDVRHHADLQAG
jgi:phosphate transport system protein